MPIKRTKFLHYPCFYIRQRLVVNFTHIAHSCFVEASKLPNTRSRSIYNKQLSHSDDWVSVWHLKKIKNIFASSEASCLFSAILIILGANCSKLICRLSTNYCRVQNIVNCHIYFQVTVQILLTGTPYFPRLQLFN